MKVRRILGARRRPVALFVVALAAAAIAGIAAAATPGVDPQTVTNTVNPGDSFNVAKTVHTPVIPPNPDIVFLADTTGSMGDTIANVQTNATTIMNTIAGTAGVGTPEFGAANYTDFDCTDPFPFHLDQAVTATISAVQTAINTWTAGDGCDVPEAQINALLAMPSSRRSATTPTTCCQSLLNNDRIRLPRAACGEPHNSRAMFSDTRATEL